MTDFSQSSDERYGRLRGEVSAWGGLLGFLFRV